MKKQNQTASDEFLARLNSDPEFLARKKERDDAMQEQVRQWRVEGAEMLEELRQVGEHVDSVWDFVNTKRKYVRAIPVLLKHLRKPYSDRTREGIARALAVREAKDAWPILVEEYLRAPMGRGIISPGGTKEYQLSAKDGLACALSATVTDDTLEELIALAKDRKQGGSRLLLLLGLRKSKNPAAKRAIEYLRTDPDLEKEIASWRRK